MKRFFGISAVVVTLVGMIVVCNTIDNNRFDLKNDAVKSKNNQENVNPNKKSSVEYINENSTDKKLNINSYDKSLENPLLVENYMKKNNDTSLVVNSIKNTDVKTMIVDATIDSMRDTDLTGLLIVDKDETVSTVERDEEIIYADATMYDYYSDSQIGSGSKPLSITDARYSGFHGHFNRSLLKYMKFGSPSQTPTKYPMYLGNFLKSSKGESYDGIFYSTDEECAISNFYRGCNSGVYSTVATPGLIDDRLTYVGGESYITMSNPDNGRWAYVPYFNKSFLLNKKIKSGSNLSMGNVIEDLKFPFRRTEENGVLYYTFDSRVDVARFNSKMELEYKGTDGSEIVLDNAGGPSFLPFNTPGTDLFNLNLCFGMKIEIPFYMTSDGRINGKDVVFEFSGDDDVWIFVDDELILDIGGCHRRVGGSINFRKQEGVVEGWVNTKVAYSKRLIYIDAELTHWTDPAAGLHNEPLAYYDVKTKFSPSLKKSFKDSSKRHMITVFYMERAKGASNLYIKFNLPTDKTYKKTAGKYILFPLH